MSTLKHPRFTQKHYIAIAELLKDSYTEHPRNYYTIADVAIAFIRLFKPDNPKFDKDRFMDAIYKD